MWVMLLNYCHLQQKVAGSDELYRGGSFFQGSITEMKRSYKSETSSMTAQLSNN